MCTHEVVHIVIIVHIMHSKKFYIRVYLHYEELTRRKRFVVAV
jgi:hypothetical protein